MSPTVMRPCTAKIAPAMATATYPKLLTKPMIGIMRPERNCERHADW